MGGLVLAPEEPAGPGPPRGEAGRSMEVMSSMAAMSRPGEAVKALGRHPAAPATATGGIRPLELAAVEIRPLDPAAAGIRPLAPW